MLRPSNDKLDQRQRREAQLRLLDGAGTKTYCDILAGQLQVTKRASEHDCHRAFKKHRAVKLNPVDKEKRTHLADGVAITRLHPRKRLGSSYRKATVVVSPEEEMRERFGRDESDVDELGLRPIPLAIKNAIDRGQRWNDPVAYSNARYQPNAKDTLPKYAYKLALRREERGERPDCVPETKLVKTHANANRPIPPVKASSSSWVNESTPQVLEDSTGWHDVMIQHARRP